MSSHSCGHRRYGMTCDEYDALAHRQGRNCALCQSRRTLVIDHQHELGMKAVRGLVCSPCNQILRWHDSGHTPGGAGVEEYLRNAWHLEHRAGLTPLPRTPGEDDPDALPVGPLEIQRMLGVSRQRFGQLRQQPGFPEPWSVLAKVTLWRDTDIAAWAKRHGRATHPHGVEQSPHWAAR